MNYRLAHCVELVEREGGIFLLSKSPLCVLRLNRSLADLVGRGAGGAVIEPSGAEVHVMEQLASKGFVERLPGTPQRPAELPDISIVIPVKDRADELNRCLTSLSCLNYPQEKLQVIVVDDGSSDDSPLVARQFRAMLVPSGGTGRGPAAARNVGASMAGGEILAFIDSDCSASKEWLNELVPAFTNPALAAVGGQVDGMCTESAVDRYESIMSSLSLGTRERTGSGGSDTFYLPSCNLLVRRTAFRNAGGFKDSMHVGEDVDLTWRLRDNGWTISYLPAGNVLHEHRSSIRSFMSRRFDYGTSEGMLQLLHPRRRKQMVVPLLLALLLALCLITPFVGIWPLLLALGLLAVDTISVRVRLARRGLPVGLLALACGRLRALGSLIYYVSYHLVRYYAAPLIVIALFVPGFWAWALPAAALLCAAGVDHAVRRPPLSFVRFCGIYLLEHIAYGAGVFWGCLSRRCFSSYRVVLHRHVEQSA
jgi:mycofactocin system glycosyltransferase